MPWSTTQQSRGKMIAHAAIWMDLKGIIWSEKNPVSKVTWCMIALLEKS